MTRREFIKLVSVCLSQQVFIFKVNASEFALPEIVEDQGVSFFAFHELSKLITNSEHLDETISRKIYELITAEPWGAANLDKVYTRFFELQTRSENGTDVIVDAGNFTNDEQWFISHLLLTWYTGIYFHERGNKHITLKHALMYEKLSNFRLPPTYCMGEPGYWYNPPIFKAKNIKK